MQAIATTTATTATTFLKPLAESGIIPGAEFKALTRAIQQAATPTSPESSKPSGLITLAEAARLLKCCKRTVARMGTAGELTRHYLRPGSAKSLRFSAAEVAKFCNQHEQV